MQKLKELKTLYLYLTIAFVGVVLFLVDSPSAIAAYAAMVLIGFGAGATFPVVLNYIGGAFKDLSGTAFSIAMFIGLCGQSLGNKFIGVQYDAANYGTLPITLIICIAVMMVLVPVATKLSKK